MTKNDSRSESTSRFQQFKAFLDRAWRYTSNQSLDHERFLIAMHNGRTRHADEAAFTLAWDASQAYSAARIARAITTLKITDAAHVVVLGIVHVSGKGTMASLERMSRGRFRDGFRTSLRKMVKLGYVEATKWKGLNEYSLTEKGEANLRVWLNLSHDNEKAHRSAILDDAHDEAREIAYDAGHDALIETDSEGNLYDRRRSLADMMDEALVMNRAHDVREYAEASGLEPLTPSSEVEAARKRIDVEDANASVVAARNEESKRELTHFLAVGPFAWGRGESVKEAVVQARVNVPRSFPGKPEFHVYKVSEGATVDGMGSLVYQQDDASPVFVGKFDRTARAK